jgi:hypothetical protein
MEDKNGRTIYPGDLLKTYHFTGIHHKKHYLYHVAVQREGVLLAIPVSELEPSLIGQGGVCPIDQLGRDVEIISGYGPPPALSFEDRTKMKQELSD